MKTQTCGCCGGRLPCEAIWEHCRDTDGECDGSVDSDGRCRAYDDDAWALHDMAVVIDRHGSRFSGNSLGDSAQDWIDHDFSPRQADDWCEIGVWDAATASEFRAANLSPREVKQAADQYTDGDPIAEITAHIHARSIRRGYGGT